VLNQYGSNLPLGVGIIGSLLVTEMILQEVGPPQLSVAVAFTVTRVIRLVIGRRIDGVAVTLPIIGDSLSRTTTLKPHVAVLPDASVAVQVTVVVPTGNEEPGAGLQTTMTLPLPPTTTGAG